MPLMHSAACCVIAPISVTGAVAPANGIDTISAGTPARARSIRFCDAKPLQFNGGDGHSSDQAVWGLARFLTSGSTDVVEEWNHTTEK